MTTSLTATIQPTIWQDATPNVQINDIIRKPFCPIARVVGKEVLKDGRTCLVVTFPGCRDLQKEEWVLPAVEIALAPTPVAIKENDESPNCGDNGRQPLQPIAKSNKALAAIFKDRPKQYQQFLIIREELAIIGIKVGKLINSRSDAKGWRLDWDGDKAGLYWTVGDDWDVEALKSGDELTGQWEDFSLEQFLECNGIDLDPEDE